jgi:hypothetical protein
MNCIKNLIVQATGPLLPTVLTAVLNLHKNGQFKISALEVRDECAIMKPTISWRNRIPAICNGMRKLTDCNWRIVSEDRDYNEFTIELSKNIDKINKSTKSKSTISPQNKRVKPSKKNNNMTQQTPSINELPWAKINDTSKNKLLIIGCSSSKKDGGDIIKKPKNTFGAIIKKHRELRMDYYSNLIAENDNYFYPNIKRYKSALKEEKLMEAYKRYNGTFYSDELRELYNKANLKNNFNILIISGLYGILDYKDQIIDYHLEMTKGGRRGNDWNDTEIKNVILNYINNKEIADTNVFYCISKGYQEALNPKPEWHNLWVGGDHGHKSANHLKDFLS